VVKSTSENAPTRTNKQNQITKTTTKPDQRSPEQRKPARKKRSAGPAGRNRATPFAGARVIVLVGFMGAGKTSVGRALSERLGWDFEDLDERIERRESRTVPEIFRDSGESAFRRAESAALQELLEELGRGVEKVVALGGGAFVQESNARMIEAAAVPVIFLDADAEQLWKRCHEQSLQEKTEEEKTDRPLLGNWESFLQLYQARRQHYLMAPFCHETTGKTIEQIATEIILALGLNQPRLGRGKKH
jgi:shikimate kinase